MTPYDILGVSSAASPDEIKSAYRRKAKIYHPDNQETGDEAKFKEISNAFSDLTEGRPHPGREFNFDEIFASTFADFFRPRQTANRDVSATLEMTLDQVFTGHEVEIKTSNEPDAKAYTVKIPRSIRHGQKIRIAGAGQNTDPNLPPGDFYLIVVIRQHEVFDRQVHALMMNIHIDSLTAILGTTIVVAGIDGTDVDVVVPPGIQFGDVILVPNHGMYEPSSDSRAPLLVTVGVITPTNLTEKHRVLVEQLKETLARDNDLG